METYKDCVIITGHTHLELSAQYNYSDNNGTSAVMIHNSAIGGVRRLVNGSVDRTAVKGLSEGYIVEVYKDFVLFNGTNLYYNETMPQCCYIVEMSTSEKEDDDTDPTEPQSDTVRITLRDETGEGWMKNNASEREIQLIDNDTNTKYIMTSYDGYNTWSVEVPRSVTDITFKKIVQCLTCISFTIKVDFPERTVFIHWNTSMIIKIFIIAKVQTSGFHKELCMFL